MYNKTILNNGLRVVTANMPYARSVTVGIYLATGSRYEHKSEMGVSHFLEHILFKGSKKYPTSRELSIAVESVGGILNGETDKELTVYWCKVARPHFHIALDVLTDMILSSKFDPAEIDKERQVIIEEINRCKDSPAQEVDQITDEILWPGHPLGDDIAGTKETVSSMTRENMLDYMAHQYSPSTAVVAIAGDVQHDEMVAAVVKATRNWKHSYEPRIYLPYNPQTNPRLKVQKKDTEQVHVCLALPGISLFDPRRFSLDLLNVVLGGGMSSRLFLEIREKLGLAYAIHSYIDHYLDSGAVIVYAGVDVKNLTIAVNAILEQLARLRDKPVPKSELSKAKELSKGRLLMRMEDSYAVSGWLGGQEVLTGKILTDDEVIGLIDAVTAKDIQNVAADLITGDKLRMAVVGPIKDEKGLEKLLKL